jgi:hypothetical protein
MRGVEHDPSSGLPNTPFPDSTPHILPPRTITTLTQQRLPNYPDAYFAYFSCVINVFSCVLS